MSQQEYKTKYHELLEQYMQRELCYARYEQLVEELEAEYLES